MGVRIRLARMGLAKKPIYNITVSDNKRGLRKEPIEVIGSYDAVPKTLPGTEDLKYKQIHIDFDRARYWLGVGALPSETVASLFRKFNLLPPKPLSKSATLAAANAAAATATLEAPEATPTDLEKPADSPTT
ncbi:ribosomal protein S16 [Limtongia smithiae]|uniref:ribosomal protein S16 n=1 Tax=Limtongia smithiae TaxID=1125753 RepID=UPI0034CF1461